MAKKRTVEDFLATAKKRLEYEIKVDSDNRREALECLQFTISGNQWDRKEKDDRTKDGRPCLEVPLLHKFTAQVVGDMLHNRARVAVKPVDSASDPHIAKIRGGIIANTEYISNAEDIYLEAGKMQVNCGYGSWRVGTRYCMDNPFLQEIYLELIPNPFMVYLDSKRKDPAGSDARYGFVMEKMDKKEFEKRYPSAEPPTKVPTVVGVKNEWFDQDTITVVEYYLLEPVKQMFCLFEDGTVREEAEAEQIVADWKERHEERLTQVQEMDIMKPEPVGPPLPPEPKIVKRRKSEVNRVKHYVITLTEILSENGLEGEPVPGKYIPILDVSGPALNIEGKTYRKGLVKDAKDAQKLVNYYECLDLDTPLPTPSGWTTMRALEVGDILFDDKGKPCSVLGTSPVHTGRECLKVVFDDGTSVVTDENHLWQVEERYKNYDNVWNTRVLKSSELEPGRHNIYLPEPLQLPEKELSVNPYTLGVWLGDGNNKDGRVTSGIEDINDLRENLEGVGEELAGIGWKKSTYSVGTFTVLGLKVKLRALGVLNNKHIPAEYLRASREQRLALLQGLMDTDGSISKFFQCDFCNISKPLADGFRELLRTLGIKTPNIVVMGAQPDGSTHNNGKPLYKFSFTCPHYEESVIFRLPRKRNKQLSKTVFQPRRTKRFRIKSVEPVASVPVKCVKVSSPSSLFLAGTLMVPTHNSSLAEVIAIAPKSPWLGTAEQFEGYEEDYLAANTKNFAYLKYNAVIGENGQMLPPPMRQQPGAPPVALFTQVQRSHDNLKAVIGMFGGDVGEVGPERSALAVTAKQKPGDISTYVYGYNLNRAIEHSGKIINEMIPEVFDSERDVRLRNVDETEAIVPINTVAGDVQKNAAANPERYKGMDPQRITQAIQKQGKGAKFNDITVGKYDVVITIGPSYATQRQETAQMLMTMTQADPKGMAQFRDILFESMDFAPAAEMASRARRTMPPGMVKLKDGETPYTPPPPPQVQLAGLKLEAEKLKIAGLQQKTQGTQRSEAGDAQMTQMKMELERLKAQSESAKIAKEREIAQLKAQHEKEKLAFGLEKQRLEILQMREAHAHAMSKPDPVGIRK